MGVSAAGAAFLMSCLRNGANFERLCTLGQQHLHTRPDDIRAAASLAGDARVAASVAAIPDPDLARFSTCGALWTAIGASAIDVLDASAFEGATVLADLNEPIPESLRARYSVVYDGGVTEHVLNAAQSIRNAAAMVEPGGHLISITPANGQNGHGMYQLSAEFYYRLLADSGEFDRVSVLLGVEGLRTRWYALEDPARLGHRVTFSTAGPADLYVLARKSARSDPAGAGSSSTAGDSPASVQQSDYESQWTDGSGQAADSRPQLRAPRMLALRQTAARLRTIAGVLRGIDGVQPIELGTWRLDG